MSPVDRGNNLLFGLAQLFSQQMAFTMVWGRNIKAHGTRQAGVRLHMWQRGHSTVDLDTHWVLTLPRRAFASSIATLRLPQVDLLAMAVPPHPPHRRLSHIRRWSKPRLGRLNCAFSAPGASFARCNQVSCTRDDAFRSRPVQHLVSRRRPHLSPAEFLGSSRR